MQSSRYICLLTVVAAIMTIGGCAGRDIELPEEPGIIWPPPTKAISAPSEEIKLQGDFTKLGDTPISLSQALELGIERNPAIRQKFQAALVAQSGVTISNSAYYPTIVGALRLDRVHQEFGFDTPIPEVTIGKIDRAQFDPAIELSATIFDFGAREADIRRAKELLFAAGFQYNRQIQQLFFEISKAFFQLNATESNIEAAEESLAEAKQVLFAANEGFRVGARPKQDTLQAESGMRKAEFDLQSAKSSVEDARAALARAIGVPVSANLKISKAPPLTNPKSTATVEQLMDTAVVQRPDLQAAWATARAQEEQAEVSKRSRWPKLLATASSDRAKDINDGAVEESYQAGLNLQWELFTGFRRSAEVKQALAQAEQQRLAANEQQLAIAAEVWSSYFSYRAAQDKRLSAEALLKSNQETYRATSEGYKNGANSLLDVLAAQSSTAAARTSDISSRAEEYIALARLAYALGERSPFL